MVKYRGTAQCTGEFPFLIDEDGIPFTQETLAEMIGTTRSGVSLFMNRFRNLGLIDYNGRIQAHKSLLNVVLLNQLPESDSEKPVL